MRKLIYTQTTKQTTLNCVIPHLKTCVACWIYANIVHLHFLVNYTIKVNFKPLFHL